MNKKEWSIKIKNNDYKIQIINNKTIKINDKQIDLISLKSNKLLYFMIEYTLQIDDKNIILSSYLGKWKLIVDGRDCDTKKEYTEIKEVPKWIYLFLILNAINLVNGAIGGMLAVLGIYLTIMVCSSKMSTLIKVLLNIIILSAMFGLIFIIASLLI